jgi:Alginate export
MNRFVLEKVFWVSGVCLFLALFFGVDGEVFGSTLDEALTGGTPSLSLRYRYERVDEQGKSHNAYANTLRTALGYRTGDFMNFTAFVQFEDVHAFGTENYNDTINGKTQYPVVADPEDTAVSQAYLAYATFERTNIIIGRQRIVLDNQRFIGDVAWRQHNQTFDALRVNTDLIAGTELTYAYIENVNRVFGEHHPTDSDFKMHTNILNISHPVFTLGTIVAYGYFLEFDDTAVNDNDSATIGLRFSGSYSPNEVLKLLYAAEYASQNDFAEGKNTIDADYFLLEVGGAVKGMTAKLSYEKLGGDGSYGFSTPLATLHAFQGWADKFLSTPNDGIRDLYVTVSAKPYDVKVAAIYHGFSSDHGSYNYGNELDLVAGRDFGKYWGAAVNYAVYHADSNSQNVGGPATDVNKLWLTGTFKF